MGQILQSEDVKVKLMSPTLDDYYLAEEEKLSGPESGRIHSITTQYQLCIIEFQDIFHKTKYILFLQ